MNNTSLKTGQILSALIIGFLALSCSYDSIAPAPEGGSKVQTYPIVNPPRVPEGSVYISGYVKSSSSTYSHSALWIDGRLAELPAMTAQSVFHYDTNVYVTAFTNATSGKQYAEYWKNGSMITLSDEAITNSIFVSGEDVYVAGNSFSGGLYWKNGQPNYLPIPDTISNAYAMSIFVSGNDVYIAGEVTSKNNFEYAAYWKNTEMHYLKTQPFVNNGSIYSNAASVYVSGNDVYIGGRISGSEHGQIATTWKNGVPTKLDSSYSYVNSVFISGSDFYAAGFNNQGGAYWKNNVLVSVGAKAVVTGIYVSGSDIYLSGYVIQNDGLHAAYWRNGVLTFLEGPLESAALSITVVNRKP